MSDRVVFNNTWRTIPDAPWFPLDVYSRSLTYEEWHITLASRVGLRWTYEHLKEHGELVDKHYEKPLTKLGPNEELKEKMLGLFDDFVIAEGGLGKVFTHEDDNPRWPVTGLNVFEAFYCSRMWEQHEHQKWREFAQRAVDEPREAFIQLPDFWRERERLPEALRPEKSDGYQAEFLDWRVPLSVDISLDDETLKFAFEVWLAGIRDALKENTPKPFRDKDIADWRLYAILPAFDLLLWSDINGLKYTATFISNQIYTDTDSYNINTYDRYRQRTRPLIEKLFTWRAVERFEYQIRLHRFLERKMREHDPEKFDKTFGPKGPPL